MSLEGLLAWFGLKWAAVIGGGFGALGSLKLFQGLTLKQSITTFLFGWAAAAFLTPLVCEQLGMAEKHYGSAGFLVGLLALSIVYNFIKALPEWIAGAKTLFLNKLGGGSNGNSDR